MSDDREALEQLFRSSVRGATHKVLHYLYFPRKKAGNAAAKELRGKGFQIEERLGADGVNWLVLASHEMVPTEETIGATRELMEGVARAGRGEYDGWEAETVDRP